jgi:type VI secretion system protein VasJ
VTVEYDALKTRAEPWVAPIAGASPAGAAARFDPEYQALADEVGKVDMPAGGEVNWKKIASGAGTLLQKKSKDLVMAAYLGRALHQTQGLAGLVTGLVVISETMEKYWDTMFPEAKRPRGRANALQWFVEKTTNALASASPGTPEEMEGLEAAARHLFQVAREKLGELCPAFGPMIEPVERLKAAAMPPEPSAPASAPAPAAGPSAAPPSPSPAAAPAFVAPAAPAGAAEAVDFLRNVGSSLTDVAVMLRQADASDPRAYRILRIGIWLHMAAAPPATGGKTQIPVPPETLRTQLATMSQNQRWAALLEEAESAASQHRFWLDLHRMTWQALSALGATHERARDAVVAEVRSLLGRMPQLPTLSFGDGTPLADPQTRTWLDETVLAGAGAAPTRRTGAGDDASAEKLGEVKKLLAATQVPEALGLLRDEAAKRRGRQRFLLSVEAARLCAGAGLTAIAKSLYEELDREGRSHHLEEWEPELAAECLKGLLASARALAKDPRGNLPDMTEPYRRLCRIDPAAAHEVWP